MATTYDEEMGLPAQAPECEPLLAKSKEVEEVDGDGDDVVQFSAQDYYADETDDKLTIDLFRLGTIRGRVAVNLSTADGTAKKDEQYGEVCTQIVLEDGEDHKTIDIPILHDYMWNPTHQFKIILSRPRNCVLGDHLNTASVKIINHDSFPSNELYDVETGTTSSDVNDWELFFDYCILNFSSAGQQWQTLAVLVGDQLMSLYIFGSLWVGVYIVDTVFAKSVSRGELIAPSRYHTILIVSLWYVLPICILYVWDSIKTRINIKGGSREFLQRSLMQTCMYYTPDSRHKVSVSDMNTAMGGGAEELANGYCALLNTIGMLGRIVAIELFIMLYQPDRMAVYSVAIVVIAILIILILREGVARKARQSAEERWLLMETLVEEAHGKYRLVADYQKKGFMSEMFAISCSEYTKESIADSLVHLNTQFVTKLLSGVCIANYIVQRAPQVLTGHCSLGIFLATISVFSVYLNDALIALNDQLCQMIDAFIPLRDFERYLNMPLELTELKRINLQNRVATGDPKSPRHQAMLLAHPGAAAAQDAASDEKDRMAIVVSDLSFQYTKDDKTVLENVNVAIPQGKLLAVVGPHAVGKSTFVQLLASILMPTSGNIFIPSHLQVLHVTREPTFLNASIMHNLLMGIQVHTAGEMKRAKAILQKLGLEVVLQMIEKQECDKEKLGDKLSSSSEGLDSAQSARSFMEDEFKLMESQEKSWELSLTHSQKVKLHIARALVTDPEVMIVDRTLQSLNHEAALEVVTVLEQHVRDKGLLQPEQSKAGRRPRTVIFSTATCLDRCDGLIEIDPVAKKINLTHHNKVTSSKPTAWSGVGTMCTPKTSPRTPSS